VNVCLQKQSNHFCEIDLLHLKLVIKKKKKKQPCSFCIFRYFQVLFSHSGFHTTNLGFPRPDRCGMYLLDSKVMELSHMRFLAQR